MNSIVNPTAHPSFGPVASTIAGLLVGSLLVMLGAHGGRWRRLTSTALVDRWRTWAVIALVVVTAALSGPLPMLTLVLLLSVQCLREYARLTELPGRYQWALLGLGVPVPVVALLSSDHLGLLLPALFAAATLLPVLVREAAGVRHLAFAVLGWAYAAWLPAHLILLHSQADSGPGIVLIVVLATALSDVGAYFVGRTIGGPPLAPAISPGKSWSGLAGNAAGALSGVWLLAFLLPAGAGPATIPILGLVIALGAVWGDLFESAIKRQFGAKDAGAWLPGFGGLLDRVDSLLIVGALVYFVGPFVW